MLKYKNNLVSFNLITKRIAKTVDSQFLACCINILILCEKFLLSFYFLVLKMTLIVETSTTCKYMKNAIHCFGYPFCY